MAGLPLRSLVVALHSRDRLVTSASLYDMAKHAYDQQDYDEAIIALEESLALRLFAYQEDGLLVRWQQGLVAPGELCWGSE